MPNTAPTNATPTKYIVGSFVKISNDSPTHPKTDVTAATKFSTPFQ